MANPSGLTMAFLQRQPLAAARAIEDIDSDDGAAFLSTVPARVSAPVVAAMAPWNAARCVERFDPEQAGGVIRAMPYQDGTTVLRLIAKDRAGAILEQVPKRLARDFMNSLNYPKGSVGAWMDHGVPAFTAERSVADALKSLRRGGARTLHHVFVVDAGRYFVGEVDLARLLHAAAETPLGEIMDVGARPLSNRATLASVADLPQWDEYSMLPVIGRRKQLLGGLTRTALRRGLGEEATVAPVINPESLPGNLFIAFMVVCSGLLRLALQPGADGNGRAR